MPRGPEEQDGLLAGGRGAGEVRYGHGCVGEGEDWSINLWRREIEGQRGFLGFGSSESVEASLDFQTGPSFDSMLTLLSIQ